MNRLVRLTMLTAMSAALAGGLGACGLSSAERYEDCEVSDQYEDGDLTIRTQRFEEDCGYWEQNGSYFLRDGMVGGAVWHWWSWVTVGQNSYHPEGWKPPHGLKPPTESSESKKRRKQYEKKAPANNNKPTGIKNTNKKPVTSTGNQGVPKNNPALQPPAPRPPRRR